MSPWGSSPRHAGSLIHASGLALTATGCRSPSADVTLSRGGSRSITVRWGLARLCTTLECLSGHSRLSLSWRSSPTAPLGGEAKEDAGGRLPQALSSPPIAPSDRRRGARGRRAVAHQHWVLDRVPDRCTEDQFIHGETVTCMRAAPTFVGHPWASHPAGDEGGPSPWRPLTAASRSPGRHPRAAL